MSDKDEEEVLVVKTDVMFPNGVKEGLFAADEKDLLQTITKHGSFLKRKFAEKDPGWQQIIPQISLVVGKKIFIHRIPDTTNEKRLKDMWPIFLGGHVNNIDGGIMEALKREFDEEIRYKGQIVKKTFIGIVKKSEPLVNKVHTGLVWVFQGDSEEFEGTGDNGIADGRFVMLQELRKYYSKMSYWSRIAAPEIARQFSR